MKYRIKSIKEVQEQVGRTNIFNTDIDYVYIIPQMKDWFGKVVEINKHLEDTFHIVGDSAQYYWPMSILTDVITPKGNRYS